MKIKSFSISSYRCFESAYFELSDINLFVGANNSGKSSILRAIASFQQGLPSDPKDMRIGEDISVLSFNVDEVPFSLGFGSYSNGVHSFKKIFGKNQDGTYLNGRLINSGFSSDFSKSVFIPFLTRRKGNWLQEQVKAEHVEKTPGDFNYLVSRLSIVLNETHPRSAYFKAACEDVLGFPIGLVPSINGQVPGIYVSEDESIEISRMGEGVMHVVALIEYLATAKNKVFLIEELENDLHPNALRKLIRLIVESARDRGNQFLVTTHSNVVVSHLGAVDNSRLFRVNSISQRGVPTSEVRAVKDDIEARLTLLEDLGYLASDYALHDAWIFFEESSAEQIVRGFIIPWFFPEMRWVRTFSAAGVDKLKAKLEHFQTLVTYAHLQPVYQSKTWVFVDGDDAGKSVLEKLVKNFKTWPEDRFVAFELPCFEQYYPCEFREEVEEALKSNSEDDRRSKKKKLLLDVIAWLNEDKERGISALEKSAREIIDKIKVIHDFLFPVR